MTSYRRSAGLRIRDGRLVVPGPVGSGEVLVLDLDMDTGALREAWIEPAEPPVSPAVIELFQPFRAE